jgi:hypothetical protein
MTSLVVRADSDVVAQTSGGKLSAVKHLGIFPLPITAKGSF